MAESSPSHNKNWDNAIIGLSLDLVVIYNIDKVSYALPILCMFLCK